MFTRFKPHKGIDHYLRYLHSDMLQRGELSEEQKKHVYEDYCEYAMVKGHPSITRQQFNKIIEKVYGIKIDRLWSNELRRKICVYHITVEVLNMCGIAPLKDIFFGNNNETYTTSFFILNGRKYQMKTTIELLD